MAFWGACCAMADGAVRDTRTRVERRARQLSVPASARLDAELQMCAVYAVPPSVSVGW